MGIILFSNWNMTIFVCDYVQFRIFPVGFSNNFNLEKQTIPMTENAMDFHYEFDYSKIQVGLSTFL